MHDSLFRRNFRNLINVLDLIGVTALDGYKSKMTLTKTGSAKFAEPVFFLRRGNTWRVVAGAVLYDFTPVIKVMPF